MPSEPHALYPREGSLPPPNSPVHLYQDKHHDTSREPGLAHQPKADVDRPPMLRAMGGNVIWLTLSDFLKDHLPVPRKLFVSEFPSDKLKTIREAFEEMIQNHKKRSPKGSCNEDQLATEFAAIINEHVLQHVAGKPVGQSSDVNTASGQSCKTRMVETVPSYVMKLSLYKADENDKTRSKSDAALFKSDTKLKEDRPNFAHQRSFVEFKEGETDGDAFDDRLKQAVEAIAVKREKVRGQIISYTDRVLVYQFRTAVFSFLVLGSKFRVMRWDRSGVFVSEKVSYVEHTDNLIEALLAFLVMDDESQGFDPTATMLEEGSEDYELMDALADPAVPLPGNALVVSHEEGTPLPPQIAAPVAPMPASLPSHPTPSDAEAITDDDDDDPPPLSDDEDDDSIEEDGSFVFEYVLEYFRDSVKGDWPRYRLKINSDEFLVGEPLYHTRGVVGRGMRGFVAFHKQSERFVFLKDAWRPFYSGVLSEGEILRKLNNKGVTNIPTLVCYESMSGQVTRVSDYVMEDVKTNEQRKEQAQKSTEEVDVEARPYVRHYAHHRLALKEVCLPLTAFNSSRQLVSVVGDSIDAHCDATQKSNTIHRDISTGNILILPTFVQPESGKDRTWRVVWRGILADWELSKPIVAKKEDSMARQPERTGTFRYMSVASLQDAFHIPTTPDELESFFNVILHNSVRFCPHNMESRVAQLIRGYFTNLELHDGRVECPPLKLFMITQCGQLRYWTQDKLVFGQPDSPNVPLNGLLMNLLGWFKARYDVMAYNRSLEREKSASASPTNQLQLPFGDPKLNMDLFSWSTNEQGPTPPSAMTIQSAGFVETHDVVQKLFKMVKAMPWPEDEVIQDRLNVPAARQPLGSIPEEGVFGIGPSTSVTDGSPQSVPVYAPQPSVKHPTGVIAATASGALSKSRRKKKPVLYSSRRLD